MATNHRRRDEREGFTCIRCKIHIPAIGFGTRHRNHCPRCLWSRHVDERPGDRQNPCRAPMEPIAISVRSDHDEWVLIHRCTACAELIVNRIGGLLSGRIQATRSAGHLRKRARPRDEDVLNRRVRKRATWGVWASRPPAREAGGTPTLPRAA